jgi:hypothetical protein
MLTQGGSSFQRRAHPVISGKPQVSASVRISSTIETARVPTRLTHDMHGRHMFWDKFVHPPPRRPGQPFQALPLLY